MTLNDKREHVKIEVEIIQWTIMQKCSTSIPRIPHFECVNMVLQLKYQGFLVIFRAQTVSQTAMEMTELQAALWLKQNFF